MSGSKLLALVLFSFLAIAILKEYALIVLGLIILWYLIRFIADIFWWGKDKGKW